MNSELDELKEAARSHKIMAIVARIGFCAAWGGCVVSFLAAYIYGAALGAVAGVMCLAMALVCNVWMHEEGYNLRTVLHELDVEWTRNYATYKED